MTQTMIFGKDTVRFVRERTSYRWKVVNQLKKGDTVVLKIDGKDVVYSVITRQSTNKRRRNLRLYLVELYDVSKDQYSLFNVPENLPILTVAPELLECLDRLI